MCNPWVLESITANYEVLQMLLNESLEFIRETEMRSQIIEVSTYMKPFDFFFGILKGESLLKKCQFEQDAPIINYVCSRGSEDSKNYVACLYTQAPADAGPTSYGFSSNPCAIVPLPVRESWLEVQLKIHTNRHVHA